VLWHFQLNRKLRIDMAIRVSKPASLTSARPTDNLGFRQGGIARAPKDDPQDAIRAAIRQRRRMLGLTQEQAAALLGLPRLTYYRIETGRRRIHARELAAICTAYDCPVGELVEDDALARAFVRAAAGLLPVSLPPGEPRNR
jgi:DNA-binding XRE family transcriptional regulator